MIAGGQDLQTQNINTSYILVVNFTGSSITKIEYKTLPNVPHSFGLASFGNFNGRSLIMGGTGTNGQCFEFDQEQYDVIPSLNENRFHAASTFIQNKIVILGGVNVGGVNGRNYRRIDSIETLDWHGSNHGAQWMESPSKLPIKVCSHTMVTLNNELFVIGGSVEAIGGTNDLDTIWIGTFDVQENKISWVEMGLRLQKRRSGHFSFVISNQIIIFGGCGGGFDSRTPYGVGEDFVEIIFGNEIERGPKVPVDLNTDIDQAVLDRKNRIIILSRGHGLIVYDHQHRSFQHFPNFTLKDKRMYYASILNDLY